MEYIARHDLNNAAAGDFSEKDVLYASEIGLIVDRPGEMAALFEERLRLSPYRGHSPSFQPMGDAHGLLLLLQRGTLWTARDSGSHATAVFETDVQVRGAEALEWAVPGYPYRIRQS